ncbi:ovarian-specific serine/threonine-protein kinase Lok [Nilaparvata lugens]|uniref:ovarian-specific serine/threonine-protein kinase Lok n=1 Tax=Nilaparvata lugens TaxID=108931 RepID=UPI000B97FF85|nr:ovarian-specific serine/threonine-protein kinase Lok [Nilaparvata lugens]
MEGHEEPTTQPISEACRSQETDDESVNEVWGKLYPLSYRLQETELTLPSYKVGRGMECDIRLTSECIDTSVLNLISKVQFEVKLTKDDSGIEVFCLKDLSSNGTFVNKKKIGRNNTVFLKTSDEISLSQPQNKAYLFVDARLCNSWLPASEKHRYDILNDLGSGSFGVVKMAVNKKTRCRYAIKKLLRNKYIGENEKKMNEMRIANEIKIISSLDHAFIVKLKEVFENEDAVFMVLEYMPGGDLKHKLCQEKRLRDNDCKIIFYQLFLGVQYLHKQGVTHRDLKPENILLSTENGILKVKISDFGLSKLIHAGTALKSHCGTLQYTAPEVIMSRGRESYTPKVDIWSLGCILYLCLSGKTPFNGRANMRIEEQIVRGYYKKLTVVNNLNHVNTATDAVNLVEKMLVVESEQRFSIDEVLSHVWSQDKQIEATVKKLLDGYGKEDQENVSPEFQPPKKMRMIEER